MGGHGLLKVSPGPALRYPSTPCRRATPDRALWPFLGCPTLRVGGLQQSSSLLDTPRHTSMITIRIFRSFFQKPTIYGVHGQPLPYAYAEMCCFIFEISIDQAKSGRLKGKSLP
jgi:hypothetical protein